MRFGVIGHPVGHSLSPVIHRAALELLGLPHTYDKFDVEPDGLVGFVEGVRQGSLAGFNVTHPHKVRIMSLLDELTPEASSCGAVNTVIVRGPVLVGHNTDGQGFWDSVAEAMPGLDPLARVVVLGSGGAARAIVTTALASGRQVTVVSRVRRGWIPCPWAPWAAHPDTVAAFDACDLLVSCTSLASGSTPGDPGWTAAVDAYARLPLAALGPGCRVVDVVYSPMVTPLLQWASDHGLQWSSGLGMLVHQAALSLHAWLGVRPDVGVMWSAALAHLGG